MSEKSIGLTLSQVTEFVEAIEQGLWSKTKVLPRLKKLTLALPSDEVWEVPGRDTALDDRIREALVIAGRKLPRALTYLIEKMEQDPRIRRQLASVLATISHGQLELESLLFELGSHEVPAVRWAVVRALAKVDVDAAAAITRLVGLIEICRDEVSQEFVIEELERRGTDSPAVHVRLLNEIREQRCYGRKTLLTDVLHRIAEVDKRFVLWLLDRRDDPDIDLRKRIARVITESPFLPEVFPQLGLNIHKCHQHMVRYVLGEVADGDLLRLVPLCQVALKDSDEAVRCGALIALGKLGHVAKDVFDQLLRVATEDSSEINRNLAAKALVAIDASRTRYEASDLMDKAQASGNPNAYFELESLLREAYANQAIA